MKKLLCILFISSALIACNDTDGDGNKDINIHIDLDSTGAKVKEKLDKFGDSASAKAKRLQKKLDDKFDSAKLKL